MADAAATDDDAAGAPAGAVSGGSNKAKDALDGGILNSGAANVLPGDLDAAADTSLASKAGTSAGGGSEGGGKGATGAVSNKAAAVAHSGLLGTAAGSVHVSGGMLSKRFTIRAKWSALSRVKDARRMSSRSPRAAGTRQSSAADVLPDSATPNTVESGGALALGT